MFSLDFGGPCHFQASKSGAQYFVADDYTNFQLRSAWGAGGEILFPYGGKKNTKTVGGFFTMWRFAGLSARTFSSLDVEAGSAISSCVFDVEARLAISSGVFCKKRCPLYLRRKKYTKKKHPPPNSHSRQYLRLVLRIGEQNRCDSARSPVSDRSCADLDLFDLICSSEGGPD